MPPGDPSPSIEPLLRARAQNQYIDPSLQLRSFPRPAAAAATPKSREEKDDFLDFLKSLGRLAVSPVTVPLNLIRRTLTSPLTISLILKLILLGILVLSSAVFSILAVGAFWWSWGTGGVVEVEGWLTYGSRTHRTPHVMVPLSSSRFQEDLRYDVEVEMELVRPNRASEEFGNFMLSLELRSQRNPETVIISAAQPSLPPPPLLTSYIPVVPFPCLLPWPVRFLCPSRLLGTSDNRKSNLRRGKKNRSKAYFGSPVRAGDVVLLTKELMEGVVLLPGTGGEGVVGSAFISIGREDTFNDVADSACPSSLKEVRTTGWVILRFNPRPTGIRWLLSSHPIPPLLLLPPISLTLTLTSSLLAFIIITYLVKPGKQSSKSTAKISSAGGKPRSVGKGRSALSVDEQLLEERRERVFSERDREERAEAERRQREWEAVESQAAGGLRRIPEGRKRSRLGEESTIGGSETTGIAPSMATSFSPIPETSDDAASETTVTETAATESVANEEQNGSRRSSDGSEDWEVAH